MAYKLSELNGKGLPPLLEEAEEAGDREAWRLKRERIRAEWLRMTGPLPEAVPVRWDVLSETREPAYRRLHIRYDTVLGDCVTAYLLVPHGVEAGAAESAPVREQTQGATQERTLGPGREPMREPESRREPMQEQTRRRPAVLALHPTANGGKDDIALAGGRDNRRYALELAERGYVVLAPDTITAGERKLEGADYFHTGPFDERHREWSAVGKMLADHRQGLDLLCSLPYVDAGRIGAIGHSLGGYNAFFLAGMDERIAAVVSSCGLSTFYGDADPNRWGRRAWFSHLPRITDELARGEVPFDFHEIAALAAPTPFFCWIAQQDQYFPHWRHIGEAADELHRLYERLGCGDRFRALVGNDRHDFPADIRGLAYAFLDRWLL